MRARPKVAFVSDKSAPFFSGGYEIRIYELAKRLTPEYDVAILSCVPSSPSSPSEVRYVNIFPAAFQSYPTGGRSVANTALCGCKSWFLQPRFEGFDIAVIEAIPYVHLPGTIASAKRAGCRVVLDVSEAWAEPSRRQSLRDRLALKPVRHLLSRALRESDRVLATSSATERSLAVNYGTDGSRIDVVPNGVAEVDGSARSTEISQPRYDVCMIARLVPIKRVGDLICALRLLALSGKWSGRAVVVGDGPGRERLVLLARELGIEHQVDFVGYVSDSRKIEILRDSRMYVLASEREGFSVATLEAMAQGLPVIVSRPSSDDVFGVSEFVRSEVNGIFYPCGDVNRLAQSISRLLSDVALRNRLGVAAQLSARAYTWEAASNRLRRALSTLELSPSHAAHPDG